TMLVFLLVIGTDFARLWYAYLTITNCARNGALYGCLSTANSTDTTNIKAAAQADVGSLTIPSGNITSSTLSDADGNTAVSVSVSYDFYTLIDYPQLTGFAKVNYKTTISRTVQMRVAPSQHD